MRVIPQLQQKGHCGPTCVAMLLQCYGEVHTQDAIAEAAGVSASIADNGSRIDQLAHAVSKLAPGHVLMGRYDSDLNLIVQMTDILDIPVGVEWQGCFRRSDGTTFDIGHFSLITRVDARRGSMEIVDPDVSSVYADGAIRIADFIARWWEDNEAYPGVKSRSFRLAFVIVPMARESQVRTFGFEPMTFDLISSVSIEL